MFADNGLTGLQFFRFGRFMFDFVLIVDVLGR